MFPFFLIFLRIRVVIGAFSIHPIIHSFVSLFVRCVHAFVCLFLCHYLIDVGFRCDSFFAMCNLRHIITPIVLWPLGTLCFPLYSFAVGDKQCSFDRRRSYPRIRAPT